MNEIGEKKKERETEFQRGNEQSTETTNDGKNRQQETNGKAFFLFKGIH